MIERRILLVLASVLLSSVVAASSGGGDEASSSESSAPSSDWWRGRIDSWWSTPDPTPEAAWLEVQTRSKTGAAVSADTSCDGIPSGSGGSVTITSTICSADLPATFSNKIPNDNADSQIKLAIENFRGTEPCKQWFKELMCRYTYPAAVSTETGSGYPCREECEIYRANCPFPLQSCDSFPSNPVCCFRFSKRRMPWNPAQVLMPFSPIVFGLLILGGIIFFWWAITRQATAQDMARSRRVEYHDTTTLSGAGGNEISINSNARTAVHVRDTEL